MAVYIPDENGDLTAVAQTVTEVGQPIVQTGDLGAAFAKMLLSLAVLILLLFLSYWFIKRLIQHRLQKGVGDSSIHILEKRMLSPKTMLYLVEVDNKKVLLAESHLEIKKVESFEQK